MATADRPTVVLTGCGGTPTQNVVRALEHAGAGYRIVGTDSDPYRLRLGTGYDARYRVPPADDPDYLRVLNEVIRAEGAVLVHAQPDPEVAVLSARRAELAAPIRLPAPPVVDLCHDKVDTKRRLAAAGVPTAHFRPLHGPGDVDAAFEGLGSPLWVRASRGAGGRGALRVASPRHGRMWVEYWDGWGAFVAEELLPGRNLGWQALYESGRLVASIAWERLVYVIRRAAPSGVTGTPAVARLIEDDAAHEVGARAVAAVDPLPHGIYGVDMKGRSDGTPCVTEINPGRFYEPSFLFARAGYPIARKHFELALGRKGGAAIPPRMHPEKDLYWMRGLDMTPVFMEGADFPAVGARV